MGLTGQTLYVILVIGSFFVLLQILERMRPLRFPSTSLAEVLLNLAIAGTAFAVAAWAVRPVVMATIVSTTRQHFGLVHLLPLSRPVRGVLAFLCMDLTFYYWHRLNHQLSALWRFHNVHHVDPSLGVSTSFRFHFGEVALSAVFRILQVTLIGTDFLVYSVYEVAFQTSTLFHHSNVRLPIRLERWLNCFLVTPRMHGIHHSQVREENLSNFSVVLPWWDRLHRTLRLNIPQSRIAIGIPGYSRLEDNRFLGLLAMPFQEQRDYWRGPDGPVERHPAERGPDLTRLEE